MLYSKARPLIKSGDLIAFSNDSLVGGAIRMRTGSSYSHIGRAYKMESGGIDRLFIVESCEFHGTQFRPLSLCMPFHWLSSGAEWTRDADEFVWRTIGARYDYASIVRRLFGFAPAQDEFYYCSEYAGEIGALMGAEISDEAFADPGQLVSAELDGGAIHRVVT